VKRPPPPLAAVLLAPFVLVVHPVHAQEIRLTGPLTGAPTATNRVHYLPFALRGDLRFGGMMGASATKNHDASRATGFGGAVRFRQATTLAWELDAGVLRGMEDASELRVPVSLRAIVIFASTRWPEWEPFLAGGPSLERVTGDTTRGTFVGAELGIGLDRRVDPVFNRFIVELVLSERRGVDGASGWATAAMLRIGIATTFGIMQ